MGGVRAAAPQGSAAARRVRAEGGSALGGGGSGAGGGAAHDAAGAAISSPLLESSIEGAQGVLLSIAGGSDLGLFEVNEAAEVVAAAAHPEANIIFGAVIDDSMMDQIRVTVIATGFEGRRKQASLVLDGQQEESTLPTASGVPVFEPISEDDLDIPAFLKRRG